MRNSSAGKETFRTCFGRGGKGKIQLYSRREEGKRCRYVY